MIREECKELTLSDRKFLIEKFDAMTALYIAYQIMSQMLPGGLDKQVSGMLPSGAQDNRKMMTEDEFKSLMKKCLSVCYEDLPAGPAQVIRGNGGWGVMNIEKNLGIVLPLVINAIMFNVQGFFEGGALTELKASLADINLPGVSMSTNSSTPL
jgi:hypothetical protein